MSKITVEESNLVAVADSIRSKGGTSGSLKFPEGFISAVADIKTGITPTGNKNITSNGTHDVTAFANAVVNVPVGYTKRKRITFTTTANSGVINVTGIGFKPRAVAIVINKDTTLANLITCAFIWDETLGTKGNATSSAASRILNFGGSLNLTPNDDGFKTNSTYGTFKSGVKYDVFCWG